MNAAMLSVANVSDVFLSYAREDQSKAEALAAILARQGWSVWWDRAILAGRSFEDDIERELGQAAVVVVLWSRASIASSWVRNEAAEGMTRQILVPARIDAAAIPLAFRGLPSAGLVIATTMVGISALAVWARRHRPLPRALAAVELELLVVALLFAAGITLNRGASPWVEWPQLVKHFWPVLLRGWISLALLAAAGQWITSLFLRRAR